MESHTGKSLELPLVIEPKPLPKLFNEVIEIRGIHTTLGIDASTVRSLRKLSRNGGYVSDRKMREILTAAGYGCRQVELWG